MNLKRKIKEQQTIDLFADVVEEQKTAPAPVAKKAAAKKQAPAVTEEAPAPLELLAAAGECDLDALDAGKKYPAPTVAEGGSLRAWAPAEKAREQEPAPVEKAQEQPKKVAKKATKKATKKQAAPEKQKTKKQQEQEEKERKKAELQEKINAAINDIMIIAKKHSIEVYKSLNWLWFGEMDPKTQNKIDLELIDKDLGVLHWACKKECYCWHHPEDRRGVHGGAEQEMAQIVAKYGSVRIA